MKVKLLLAAGLVAALVGGAAAEASVPAPHGRVAATVPDVTGSWRNKDDTVSPAWHLTTSDGLQTLDATWRGGPGHTDLRGSFHGTLRQSGGSSAYVGSFGVDENGNSSGGTMTWTILSATKMDLDIEGGSSAHYVFIRVGGAPSPQPFVDLPTPASFGSAVTGAAPEPGGVATLASPSIPPSAEDVVAEIGGLTNADFAVLEAQKHQCYVNFVRAIVTTIGASSTGSEAKIDDDYAAFIPVLLVHLRANLDECVAFVEATELVLATSSRYARAAGASCAMTAVKLSTTGSGAESHLQSFKLKNVDPLRVTCARRSGKLEVKVASPSKRRSLRSIVGPRLRLAVARSSKDRPGGKLSVKFARG